MQKQEVIVTDIQMPFSSMVFFMIKWAVATIPAAIILFIFGALSMAILTSIGSSIKV
ncbi:MAG: hypothetical protein ACNA8H_06480 [Anaerolineales bacterium]